MEIQNVGLVDLEGQFDAISRLMYSISGVNLTDGKRELVKARLSKRMRAMGWSSIRRYIEHVQSEEGRDELARMVDALTTNKTSFFRESAHFDFIRDTILPDFRDPRRPLRAWSAGCSSGEEPYTLAMVLADAFSDLPVRDCRIMATDISSKVLAMARAAVYDEERMEGIPDSCRRRYFNRFKNRETGALRYQVVPELRTLVTIGRLNLMERWPMSGPFDFILCRNVMIYFDRETRGRLLQRFTDLLSPGGHLLVGHSESLNSMRHDLTYVQPAVYRK
jgi:chemotaxis protein methyltransferase CheR